MTNGNDLFLFDRSVSTPSLRANTIVMKGDIIVTNTLEDFKTRDKQKLLESFAEKTWNAMQSSINQTDCDESLEEKLTRFLLLTYLVSGIPRSSCSLEHEVVLSSFILMLQNVSSFKMFSTFSICCSFYNICPSCVSITLITSRSPS